MPLLLLMCCIGSSALAAADPRVGWLPTQPAVKPLMAVSAEAVNELSFSRFRRNGDTATLGHGKLGLEYVFHGWKRGDAVTQVGLMASTQSQFNMSTSSDDLINTDYFLAIPVMWSNGRWGARGRLLHQSSHLGDEFLLSGDAPERKNLSYEALDLMIDHRPRAGWRLYASAGYVIASDLDEIGNIGGSVGVEYISPDPVLGAAHWITVTNVTTTEAFESDAQTRLISGLRFISDGGKRNALTLALQGFTGPIPFGQFFNQNASYWGIALFFERF